MVYVAFWSPIVISKALAKAFYNTSPDIVFGGAHAVVGIGLIGFTLFMKGTDLHTYTRKYKLYNVVVRSDDPRAQNIKRTCGLDVKK